MSLYISDTWDTAHARICLDTAADSDPESPDCSEHTDETRYFAAVAAAAYDDVAVVAAVGSSSANGAAVAVESWSCYWFDSVAFRAEVVVVVAVVVAVDEEEAIVAVEAVVVDRLVVADKNYYYAAADTSFAVDSWDLAAVVEAEHCLEHSLAAALDLEMVDDMPEPRRDYSDCYLHQAVAVKAAVAFDSNCCYLHSTIRELVETAAVVVVVVVAAAAAASPDGVAAVGLVIEALIDDEKAAAAVAAPVLAAFN